MIASMRREVGDGVRSKLTAAGYLVPEVVDKGGVNPPAVSVVQYREGFEQAAGRVADLVGIKTRMPLGDFPLPSRYMGEASVMVVLGPDFTP
ncbi:MAG: hypothetical protein NVS3B21_25360 [Acidimicrobiales bacterium]